MSYKNKETPSQRTQKAESWSERYYPGLTPRQHNANDIWFQNMLDILTNTGMLLVPNLGKSFNKQGVEIQGS